jgi:hypothetical protein
VRYGSIGAGMPPAVRRGGERGMPEAGARMGGTGGPWAWMSRGMAGQEAILTDPAPAPFPIPDSPAKCGVARGHFAASANRGMGLAHTPPLVRGRSRLPFKDAAARLLDPAPEQRQDLRQRGPQGGRFAVAPLGREEGEPLGGVGKTGLRPPD